MAGRKQFDVDEAVRRSMHVFWERGYADTSLDLLGSATGLGRGSLYGAFGGKDDLFRRCLDRYAAVYGARHDQALAAHPDDPVRAVEAIFGVVLDRIADPSVPDGCLLAQSAAQSPTLNAESRSRVHELLGKQRKRVRTALSASGTEGREIEDEEEGGGSETEELDDLATYVVAVIQSLAVLSRAGTPLADLRAVVRIACTTVADTLTRTKAPHGPEESRWYGPARGR
ncbi:TetR/AcrR family transcriptional regulator [Streptomyces sp. NPDC059568]|uniref:TetR/AcrR family transcriptional regulator n=1 Tax=Streptomyces sp. NPDC059568 TaxID=3346868 RepID=UPI0036D1E630